MYPLNIFNGRTKVRLGSLTGKKKRERTPVNAIKSRC